MSYKFIFFLVFSFGIVCIFQCDTNVRELKCLVCTRVVEEMQKNISKVDEKKKINVGGFRLDDDGNYSQKIVPFSRSEIYLTEVMENVCNKMEDYVRATYKKDGKLAVISLVSEEGGMNPIMSEVDIVQDSDLNKSLKFYCEDILDEHDEAFVAKFKETDTNLIAELCGDVAQLCDHDYIGTSRSQVDEL